MAHDSFFCRTIIWQVRRAVVLTGAFLSTAAYASPSFDCHKATAPIEVLICANPELAKLDEKLDDAFRADIQSAEADSHAVLLVGQRSWLLRREAACQVPSKQAEQHVQEWNAMTDCISRLYRERIAELSPHATVPDTSAHSGGLIHPLCIGTVLKSSWSQETPAQDSFSLKDCTAENAEAPVSISRGTISAHELNQSAYYEYKPNAILPDGGQLLVVYDGGGGSGHGSQVAAISRTLENGEIVIHGGTVFLGADRCGGSISAATLDGANVFIDLDVNPDSFLHFAGPKSGASGASGGYNDCIGSIRIRTSLKYDDDHKAVEAVSGMVKSDTSGLRAADGNHCFDVAVSMVPGALPKQFDRPALGQLVKSYKACFAKVRANGPR